MDTRITARHFHLTDELRDHVANRLNKLEKVFTGITSSRAILSVNKGRTSEKEAEIVVNVFRQTLSASGTAETHKLAIDQCVERLRRQLLKHKSKLRRTDGEAHR